MQLFCGGRGRRSAREDRRDSALTPLQQAAHKSSWNETISQWVVRGLAELQDESSIPLLRDFTTYGQPPIAR
jgi:hypothetical protein